MGRSLVLALLEKGARVVTVDINQKGSRNHNHRYRKIQKSHFRWKGFPNYGYHVSNKPKLGYALYCEKNENPPSEKLLKIVI